MSAIADARRLLAAANDAYQTALRKVDARLRAAVCQDPANLPEATGVQDLYGKGFTCEPLTGLEQPPAPPEPVTAGTHTGFSGATFVTPEPTTHTGVSDTPVEPVVAAKTRPKRKAEQ